MGLKRSKYFLRAKTWVFAPGGSYWIIERIGSSKEFFWDHPPARTMRRTSYTTSANIAKQARELLSDDSKVAILHSAETSMTSHIWVPIYDRVRLS